MRANSLIAEEKFDAFSIEVDMRKDLYNAIIDYKKTAEGNGEWNEIGAESRRFVNHLLRDYERNGM